MIRMMFLFSVLLLSFAILADQEPNAGGFQPPQPTDNNFQSQNTSPSNLNQEFEREAEHGSLRANELKPNETMFDIKTAHGSILIKKLPPKDAADTQKGTDAQPKADIKVLQPKASTQIQPQK